MCRPPRLSAGHARALITSPDPSALARRVIEQGLSVRETERLAKAVAGKQLKAKLSGPGRDEKDADTKALEADLSANLKMSVRINHEPGGEVGILSIRYNTLDDLDLLCRVLSDLPRDGSV